MISFKQFFTEGRYVLTDSERNQINALAEHYIAKYGDKAPSKDVVIGNISFIDLADNNKKTAKVILSPKKSKTSGWYDEKKQTITLFYNNTGLYNLETIVNMISHEVYHAKQQYKDEANYEPYSDEKQKEHYTHPTEYPVYVSNFLDAIERYYVNVCNKRDQASDERSAKVWKLAKDRFLAFLESFLKSGSSNAINIPSFFSSHERFINFLVQHKNDKDVHEKYQKFFKDVAKIYTQLKEYEGR